MSSYSFHNPNGRVYEVNPASTPGTTRKILGIALILFSFLFAPWKLFILPIALLSADKTTQNIQNDAQSINLEKTNLEKATKTRMDTESALKIATEEYQNKKAILDSLYDKHQEELSKQLVNIENKEQQLKTVLESLENKRKQKKQEGWEAFSQRRFDISASLEGEINTILEQQSKIEKQLLEIKNKELPTARSLMSYPEDLYNTPAYIKAKDELNIAEVNMNTIELNYQTADGAEKNSKNNIATLQNKEIEKKESNKKQIQVEVSRFIIGLVGMGLGVLMVRSGNAATRAVEGKNPHYVINSINNGFYLPYEDMPLCQLSDISAVNKRTEKEKRRESYQESVRGKLKTKYRTVTDYTYYVQIIGAGISQDFDFDDQGERDALYSSLKAGIKEVNDFIRSNYF